MENADKLRQAERMAKNKLCYDKCFCPKHRKLPYNGIPQCDDCAVFIALRDYYLNEVIGVEKTETIDRWSWEDISKVAESGEAEDLFFLGDEKRVTLLNGEEASFVIVGFRHDDLANGGKAGITFALKGILREDFAINDNLTNIGGWRDSKMRNSHLEKIYELLPKELRSVIKPVVKLTGIGGGKGGSAISEKVVKSIDKLFLFSGVEVEGKDVYRELGCDGGFYGPEADCFTAPDEGKQYPYFVDRNNVKLLRNGERVSWWLRSPHCEDDVMFCYMYRGDELDCTGAAQKNGVCFGFCV